MAYHPVQSCWRPPSSHTQLLSHVIYLQRLVTLMHVLDPVTDVGDSRAAFLRQYRREYLSVGRAFLFDELHSQRNLGSKLAADAYRRPNIHWEEKRDAVVVYGSRVELPRLRVFVQEMITDTQDVLAHQLLFCSMADVLATDVTSLTDHFAWADYGGNLVNLNTSLAGGERRVTARLEQSSNPGCYVNLPTQPMDVRLNAYHSYTQAVYRFLALLGLLHLTCGGSPPRGSEITRLTWRNGVVRHRSWYLSDDLLCAVYDYNKTEAVAGRPLVIARFYPHCVAQMVVLFLAEVVPFWLFLAHLAEVDPTPIWRPLIWQDDGVPWPSDRLKKELAIRTQRSLGVELTLATWRHLHIAINKALVDSDGPMPNGRALAKCFALQAGHSLELEDQHYALTAEDLMGLSAHTLSVFKAGSLRWHAFLGIADQPYVRPAKVGKREPCVARNQSVNTTLSGSELPVVPSMAGPDTSATLSEILVQLRQLQQRLDALQVTSTRGSGSPTGLTDLPTEGDAVTTPRKRRRKSSTSSLVLSETPECWSRLVSHFEAVHGPDFAFRGQQESMIQTMLSPSCPRHLFIGMPTGGGKTLLIESSALAHPGQATVVVVPTISLKQDLVARLDRAKIAHLEYSAASFTVTYCSVILVVMESTTYDTFRHLLMVLHSRGQLARTFWDEAHLIVLEGVGNDGMPGFRPWLSAIQRWPTDEAHVFLSATMPSEVESAIQDILQVPRERCLTMKTCFRVPRLRYEVRRIVADAFNVEIQHLIQAPGGQRLKTLIFVRSQAQGVRIASAGQWPFYYGGVSKTERGRTMLQDFRTNTACDVLVATTAAAHGLDCVLDQVIICDTPFDLLTAMQQAGRAARHRVGRCVILLGKDPAPPRPDRCTVGVTALFHFLTTPICRRQILGDYFNGGQPQFCGPDDIPCDRCQPEWCVPPRPDTSRLDALLSLTMDSSRSSSGPRPCTASRPSPDIPRVGIPQADTVSFPGLSTDMTSGDARSSHGVRADPDFDTDFGFGPSSGFFPSSPPSTRRSKSPDDHSGTESSKRPGYPGFISAKSLVPVVPVSRPQLPSLSTIPSTVTSPSPQRLPPMPSGFSPSSLLTPSAAAARTFTDEELWESYHIRRIEADTTPSARRSLLTVLYDVETKLGVRCHLCWLDGRSDYTSHWFRSCTANPPPVVVRASGEQQRRATHFKKSARLENMSVHFHCGFPLGGPHPGQFTRNCFRSDLLWRIVDWALLQPDYQEIFQRLELSPGHGVEGLACALLVWEGKDLQLWRLVADICEQRRQPRP